MMTTAAQKVLDILQNGTPHRTLYIARDGMWWIDYRGGGPISPEIVQELIDCRKISRAYDTCDGVYHCGKTLDTAATKAATAQFKSIKQRRQVRVYTDGSREGPATPIAEEQR